MERWNPSPAAVICTCVLTSTGFGQDPIARLEASGVEPTGPGVLRFLRELEPTPALAAKIDWWISQLDAPRFGTRERATRELRHLALAAQERLNEVAQTGSPEARRRAAELLTESGPRLERLIDAALVVLHRDPQPNCVRELLEAARWCHAAATVDRLRRELVRAVETDPSQRATVARALRAEPSSQRQIAAEALAELIRDEPSADLLIPALADPDAKIVLVAARALLQHGRLDPVQRLVELLSDDDATIRARSHAYLSAAFGWPISFTAYDPPAVRGRAIDRWHDWLAAQGDALRVAQPLRLDDEQREVIGFWASDPGSAVRRLSRAGQVVTSIDAAPYDVGACSDGRVVVTNRDAGSIVVLSPTGEEMRRIVGLKRPTDADMLDNGHLLVVEGGANRVVEYDLRNRVVWSSEGLSGPFDATRLVNGITLVADSGNDRLVEFDGTGRQVRVIDGIDFPNGVFRMADGRTIVTTYTTDTVQLFDAAGRRVWSVDIGGTAYSPKFAAGMIWAANSDTSTVMSITLDGQIAESVQLATGFNDVDYILAN